MSRVYRFHGPTDLHLDTEPILLRKRKRRGEQSIDLLSADISSICDADGVRPIETYEGARSRRTFTLTRREADLIALANPGVEPPTALEVRYPWLPRIPFLNDAAASYEAAGSLVRRYGHHFVTAVSYCDEKWNTVCNAIRRKNSLDARFHTAWHAPIQDVYLLEERRPDRSVVAIDFNSMYSACMQHAFPHPASLKHVPFNRYLERGERLDLGLYRCLLSTPSTEFIQRHNPFRSFFAGRRLLASLSEPVEVDLNEFEVEYFSRHFGSIYLLDAVISKESISHPLAKEARRCFARRRNFTAQGNQPLADREKYLATLLSSCTDRPDRIHRVFRQREQALGYLRRAHGISPPEDEPESSIDAWLRRGSHIRMVGRSDGFAVDGVDIHTAFACFLLGQRIVARGRITMLEAMEQVVDAAPGVQICYTNIDSIHFSLPTDHLDRVVAELRSKASDQMGSFKIEAITSHGLWLEPGRYWLYGNEVEKFRNRSIGDRVNAFRDHSIHVASRRIGNLHIPIRVTLQMDKSMSDARTLQVDSRSGIVLQRLLEVRSDTPFESVLDHLERNRQTSTPARMRAFRDLEHRLSRPMRVAPDSKGPASPLGCSE